MRPGSRGNAVRSSVCPSVRPSSGLALQVMLIIGSKHKLKVRFGLEAAQLVQTEQVFDFRQVRLQSHT